MPSSFDPRRLDVSAFARAGASLQGRAPLSAWERLAAEADLSASVPALPGAGAGLAEPGVHWQARAELRAVAAGSAQPWLHVQATARLPLRCQRCLGPTDTRVEVDRWFRFVADEATALAEDDRSEEDVLVLDPRFDLIGLVEDELLMALPLVPRHSQCPEPLPTPVDPAEAPAERPHPFAVLAKLKR